jgi:DNA invertase Pin-like site-specific DNA recombinase
MKKAVPYYRVSTDRQGQSGLGLEAQRNAVKNFIHYNKLHLLREYTEVESGRNNNRPQLQEALHTCKKHKATLLIAKLDRLARNVVFISQLMESDVDFVAVDNPHANKIQLHIMAAFAEYERDQISTRTKDALQAAKRRGVKLGRYAKILSRKNRKASNDFANSLKPKIRLLQKEGYETIRELTEELNRRQIATYSGTGRWHINTVYWLLKRINKL